ncbi:MAG: phage major capsid protein [Candidatus Acidiferrales bacterium]|jgi:HK97 family phage major capsid protein
MAEKNTKRVAGEDLTSDAFAYVGDAKKKSTWHLPIKFKSEAKTKRHIRNAISRFDQTDMPDKAEKEKAWKRIVAAAKKYGIEVSSEQDGKKSSVVEQQRQAEVRAGRLSRGVAADPESDDPALAWDDAGCAESRDGELEDLDELPMLSRDFQIEEMRPVRIVRKAGKRDCDPLEPDEIKDVDDSDGEEGDDDLGAAEPLDDPNKPRGTEDGEQELEAEGKAKKKKKGRNTFAISISSEYPVERWFGREILDHSPESVDLSRAQLGLSFLDSHDMRAIVGIVEGVRVADKKLRGVVRFSANPAAQAVKRDMRDKIRKFISVGYAVKEYKLEESSKEKGDTYRASSWMPMEASSVSVPADPTVGVGRAHDGERTYPVVVARVNSETRSNPDAAQAAPTPTAPAAPAQAARRKVTVEPITVEEFRKAAAEIARLGKLHGIEQERIAKWIEEGKTVDQVSREILAEIQTRGGRPLEQPASEAAREHFDLSDREQKQYNLARLILAAADGAEGRKVENCMEMEISNELRKRAVQAGRSVHSAGVFMPWSIRHSITPDIAQRFPQLVPEKRAGLYTGGSTVGQTLVFTEPGEFIQYLYNRMRVKELGARTIAGLRDNVSFPRQTGRATGSWVTENPGADVADSNLTLGAITSSPKTYQSSSSYSRQLLAQAVIDVDTLVREDLARDLALAVDSVAIQGGGSNQPSGIMATTGVQSFTNENDAGNGASPDWNDIVNMTELLEAANADQLGEGGWLTTPGIKSRLKRTARLGNTIGLPIWADDDTVDGYEARSTNQVPSNETEGSGSNLHVLIRGVFETLLINMWGSGFEFIVDPYRLKKQGMIELTTFMLVDIVLRYPVAFVVSKYNIT